jgi:hypothetical protein
MMLRNLLSTNTTLDGATLVITCTGSAETDAFAELVTALDAVHNDAMRRSAPSVVADIRGLEFASSSCLKAFVTWLQRVQELDDEHRYKVRFKSNPRHSWQRRSLGALAVFAAGVVEIDADAS